MYHLFVNYLDHPGTRRCLIVVIVSPLRIGLFPFQIAFPWFVNRGFLSIWDDLPSISQKLGMIHLNPQPNTCYVVGGVTKYLTTFCRMILQVIDVEVSPSFCRSEAKDSLRAKHNVQVLAQQSEAWMWGYICFRWWWFREGSSDEWKTNLELLNLTSFKVGWFGDFPTNSYM